MRRFSPFTGKDVLMAIILSNHFWRVGRVGAKGIGFLKYPSKRTQIAEKKRISVKKEYFALTLGACRYTVENGVCRLAEKAQGETPAES